MRRKLYLHRRWRTVPSTPVYDLSKIVGRDFPDGTSYRLFQQDGLTSFRIIFSDKSVMVRNWFKTPAAASRVACAEVSKYLHK